MEGCNNPHRMEDENEAVDEYGSDYMGDEADRAHLMSMPEIDREEILNERAERRQYLLERREVKRKLRGNTGSGRSIIVLPYNTCQESTRVKQESDSIRKLKVLRDQKTRLDAKRKRSPETHDAVEPVSAVTKPLTMPKMKLKRPSYPKITSFLAAQIPRSELMKWAYYPFFNKFITGGFVRVFLSKKPGTGDLVYRAVKVEGYSEVRPYTLEGNIFNISLKCSQGSAVKDFRLDVVSNAAITEKEYDRYVISLAQDGMPLVTEEDIDAKVNDYIEAAEYVLTDDDVNKLIEKKRELRDKGRRFGANAGIDLSAQEKTTGAFGHSKGNLSDDASRIDETTQRERLRAINEPHISVLELNEVLRKRTLMGKSNSFEDLMAEDDVEIEVL